MTQHRVIAEDSLSAMDQISKALGKDAVILETKKVNGKIEILGSNNIQDVASSNAKKINKQKSSFSHLFSNHKLEQGNQNRILNSIVQEEFEDKTDINKSNINLNTDYVDKNTFLEFTSKIENLLKNTIISDLSDYETSHHKSLTIELLKKGFSKKIISEFKDKILTEGKIDPELIFYHCLANKIVSPSEEKILEADIIFVNGPSGSGKTTLCSKIASHILDNKFIGNDRNKLSIINFAPKSSSHSELLNFGRLLNLNVTSISTLDEIVAFIDANKNNQKLIVDVSQENRNTHGYIEYLEKLSLNKKFINILALQASSNKNMIQSTMNFYKNSFPIIGLTKLDESHISAEEFSILGELNCEIGILSGSRSVIGSLAFAKKEVLAQYMKDMNI
jgi:flagellar biosynthesis GTPase FlhF